MAILGREIKARADGYLAELYSERDFEERCVHSYIVCIRPGYTRAKHYHHKKTEYLFLLKGNVCIMLADIKTGIVQKENMVAGENAVPYIKIMPQVPHAIKNNGKEDALIVVFASSHDMNDTVSYDFDEYR